MIAPFPCISCLCGSGAGTRRSRRHEHAAAVQAAVPQVGECRVDFLEAVLACLELDLASRGQGHELRQFGEAAHETADHTDLARDDLDGGEVNAAAVPDHEVRTSHFEHRRPLHRRTLLTDEVEHGLHAFAARELAYVSVSYTHL